MPATTITINLLLRLLSEMLAAAADAGNKKISRGDGSLLHKGGYYINSDNIRHQTCNTSSTRFENM